MLKAIPGLSTTLIEAVTGSIISSPEPELPNSKGATNMAGSWFSFTKLVRPTLTDELYEEENCVKALPVPKLSDKNLITSSLITSLLTYNPISLVVSSCSTWTFFGSPPIEWFIFSNNLS